MESNKTFSLFAAYDFLNSQGLEEDCIEIKTSADRYKSYRSTLRRAKIVVLLQDQNLLAEFCNTVWPYGLSDKGRKRIKFLERLLVRFNNEEDGLTSVEEDDDEETKVVQEENEFAYENDLRNYLVRNLSIIEKGLKLYEADGIDGEEFFVPGTSRRIDILAVDSNNRFVVIELKVSRGYEKVVGQTLFYQSSIKTIFKQDKVRAIIIAREITAELKTATQFLPDFELFEYELSLTLNRIK